MTEDRGLPLALRFSARAGRLRRVRQAVCRHLMHAGCGETCARDVMTAVDEACQNIIRHAYRGGPGDILLELRRDGDRLIVRLIDFAAPIDPSTVHPRPLDELRPGGLGTYLIRQLMDEIAFLPPPPGAGNLLQMTKTIGGSHEPEHP